MPISQSPSRRVPAAWRLSQPNRSAPVLSAARSVREEKGIFFSGSCSGSLIRRSSIGSIPSFSASSSIAHSSATSPTASPGARIEPESSQFTRTRSCVIFRFSPA